MFSGIPGTFLYLLLPDRIGRRPTLILAQFLVALSCVSGSCLQYLELFPTLQIICSMITRLVAGVSDKVLFLLITELFPTPIRNTAVSIGAAFGGVGSILGLLLDVLQAYYKPLPAIIVGSVNILAALMVLTLPETKGRKLPENFEDVFNELN